MSAPDFPAAMTEEAVAEWLWAVSSIEGDPEWDDANSPSKEQAFAAARAVRALLREKVREAVCAGDVTDVLDEDRADAIVARVLGEEAPRG